MKQRFTAPAGVVLMLTKIVGGRRKILLQRRKNTGFADGLWDLSSSGHVEKDESMKQAAARECLEEIGVKIKTDDLKFVCFIHKKDGDVIYYYCYFICDKFTGEPEIMEKNKCSELIWVDMENLPEDTVADRKIAVAAYFGGTHYIEYGWQ